MSQTYLPFSALCASKGNPRKTFDERTIEGLAQSIKTDGILQNLIVIPQEDGRYRIHIGKRRYLALKLLRRKGEIDDEYSVPVDIKVELTGEDALRIATVENVQREALNPIDEAEAFSVLLRNGNGIADVAAQTGMSENTVRRRLALSSLSKDAKAMVREGALPISVAEALTLGSESQQAQFIEAAKEGAHLTRERVRDALLRERPIKSAAIFPLELYKGTFTMDLFEDESATFFDDVAEFDRLQAEAVEQLAAKHRAKAEFVDVFNSYGAPWWQYRKAEKGERSGVAINRSPSGAVEVRKGLRRNAANEDVTESKDPPQAKPRPEFGPSLLQYFVHEKSIALMGALLEQPRKMMEVAAVLLLSAHLLGSRVRIDPHPCLKDQELIDARPRGYAAMEGTARALLERLGLLDEADESAIGPLYSFAGNQDEMSLYHAVQRLSDDDLAFLLSFVLLTAFGQEQFDTIDNGILSVVAKDLAVSTRQWWTPDERYLSMLRREQLESVAVESGASTRLGRLDRYKKKDLVASLANYFRKTVDPSVQLDEFDEKGRTWVPRLMHFAETETPIIETE